MPVGDLGAPAPKGSAELVHLRAPGGIAQLRQSYHLGPARIVMYLKRYHDVEISSAYVSSTPNYPANRRHRRQPRL
ncbi:hypothetical protein [Candidatus Poriferisodalis sp.]|uniref:hypothetical protein n=1 Tax=Candidatus Poriferisodalis sp. TaxID=3101277 RepID=UPI003B0136E8